MIDKLIVLDLVLLFLCTLFVVIFLYKRKHNLKREGLMYLYRTQWGVKFIEKFSKKYGNILRPAEYVVIASGFILMISGLWLIITTVYQYLSSPTIAQVIKAPPVFPIFPYFTKFFDLDSFFPDFYFIYFIVVIAIIAVSHEFAHGIFARLNKVKIHSTGFAFLGPFLGAFVEQDEKHMQRTSRFSQMAILAAGTFANVIMTIIFGIILWLFFIAAFTPAGIYFNSYSTAPIATEDIFLMKNVTLENLNTSLIEINANNKTFYTTQESISYSDENNIPYIIAYEDSPALKAGISFGEAIIEIDNQKTDSYDSLRSAITSHKPGDNVTIQTITQKGEIKYYDLTFGNRNGTAFLGIGISQNNKGGVSGFIYKTISSVKSPFVYYESSIGEFGIFIYDLLWWIVIVNLLVAIMNMLPLGIFDGGRFFYLTIWSITGNKQMGETAYKISTWFLLALILALMVKWVIVRF